MAKRIQRSSPRVSPSAAEAPRPEGGASKGRGRGGRVKADLITDFTVQRATLSEAGIPVVKSLTILEGQTRPGPFKAVLQELTEDVSGGTPLSEAMSKHEKCFDSLYSSMVRAGEAGGVLDQILVRTAAFREKSAEIRAKIVGAMIYPIVLIVVAALWWKRRLAARPGFTQLDRSSSARGADEEEGVGLTAARGDGALSDEE